MGFVCGGGGCQGEKVQGCVNKEHFTHSLSQSDFPSLSHAHTLGSSPLSLSHTNTHTHTLLSLSHLLELEPLLPHEHRADVVKGEGLVAEEVGVPAEHLPPIGKQLHTAREEKKR